MITAVHAFADELAPARRLATAMDVRFCAIQVHVFPDGESLPTVTDAHGDVVIYRSLDRPDGKLMPLLLAVDALRRAGAERVVLVAPYMSYLRQDAVFEPGQSLSRDVIGRLLGERFDAIVTVTPHLHRTTDLDSVFFPSKTIVLSAASTLLDTLAPISDRPWVIGPDGESEGLVQEIANRCGAQALTLAKTRHGDRQVEIARGALDGVVGRHVLLVDDVCSSGMTLLAALGQLRDAKPAVIDIAVAHGLFDAATVARLLRGGARRVVATDSCAHTAPIAHLAHLLAVALEGLSL